MSDKEMIEFWKANEKPFGLATSEQRAWLSDFKGPLESYGIYDHIEWGPDKDAHIRFPGRTYRIPADYQPEKRGRWVECAIEPSAAETYYIFTAPSGCRCLLHEAPGMVGFGGLKYDGKDCWARSPRWEGEGYDTEPLKPTKVRFWVEE